MDLPTIDLVGIKKTFSDSGNFEVLKEINLSAQKGEFVCVLGPSGSGKTVLLYLAAGFLEPTAGKILVDGVPIAGPNRDRVMLFQNYVLFPWKTVYGNVLFALEESKMSKPEKNQLVMKYLDLMSLASFKDWYPYKLSGGMQQRVALARALVADPKVLLMDEPFAALDPQYRKFLQRKVEEIWQKTQKTIVFVTHSIKEAILLADKIYLLSARPAVVQNIYQVDMPRPRNPFDPKFLALTKQIEDALQEEFDKTNKHSPMEDSIEYILQMSGGERNAL